MEIVFGRSAYGSLRVAAAENPGLGRVMCFNGGWSMGDIRGSGLGPEREAGLKKLLAPFPEELARSLAGLEEDRVTLEQLLASKEPVRIWYSEAPEELCGLCWLLTRLDGERKLSAVRLPEAAARGNSLVRHRCWGEVLPEEFGEFLTLERPVTPAMVLAARVTWQDLQEENARLRAVISGDLHSVPDSFYDFFLERELERIPEEDEFREAVLIGDVLGRYHLGIGDIWIGLRVEELLGRGRLRVTREPQDKRNIYRRMLKRA